MTENSHSVSPLRPQPEYGFRLDDDLGEADSIEVTFRIPHDPVVKVGDVWVSPRQLLALLEYLDKIDRELIRGQITGLSR